MSKNFFNYGIRIAIIYWLVSFLWIFTSDKILQYLIHDFDKITHFQTIKGVGFITLSALLIYFLILFYQKQQKSIESKIIENEERLRLLVESSMDAILLTAPQGKILSANPAAERIFGRTEQEIIQLGRDEFIDLSDPRLQPAIQQRTEKGYFVGELNFLRADGTIFPGDVSTKVFTDSEGNIRTSMIIRDVSERKILQDSLLASEERLRLALTGAQQGIYDINLETGEQIVNDIYAKMLGYDPETFDISLEGWMNRLHPDDYDFVTQYLKDYLSGKVDEYEAEFRMDTATGDYIWVLSLGSIVARDENGKPLRMLGTHTDITDRKLSEQEKTLFSHIVAESLNEIYVFNDRNYRFVQVNKAAMLNLGYSHEELLQLSPVDIAPEFTKEKIDVLVAPLKKGKQKQIVFETIHRRKDGSSYDVEIHLQFQKMDDQSLFTAICLDISDRNRAQKEIYEERQRLANIIEGTNVATWEWNVQTGESVFNEYWAEMLGYTMDELQPISIDTWERLTNPEDLIKAQEMLQDHFSGTIDYYDTEFRMKHKNGHWIWVQDRGRVSEWTEDGKPLIMLGTHHDITPRKESEQKIMQQLEELRRWHAITLGREERIIELKQEINHLLTDLGKSPKYESVTKTID